MVAPGPSDQRNTAVLSDDGVWNFSNKLDYVLLPFFPEISGQPVRMWGGDDFVVGDSAASSDEWANQVNGNTGNDTLLGGDIGRDKYLGGSSSDALYGGNDGDWLNGNRGIDILEGGSGDDLLRGGTDEDVLIGDSGNDILIGDLHQDILTGGGGQDAFVIRTDGSNLGFDASEADVILDYTDEDFIVLPGVESVSDLAYSIVEIDNRLGILLSIDQGVFNQPLVFLPELTEDFVFPAGGLVTGDEANTFLERANPNYFLNNPVLIEELIA